MIESLQSFLAENQLVSGGATLALMGLAGLWATAHRLDGLLKD